MGLAPGIGADGALGSSSSGALFVARIAPRVGTSLLSFICEPEKQDVAEQNATAEFC